ncbi:MAG: UDP-2,4-diacetamido-2,4,6-trideoxy-beta-L-altropyranose hydrolase [Desulfobacteraceae bacterium]|nr:UDP-2,4-diacetamido-2,4,6-trideoxy-beta-L-altropyranose hydrolase [Desulfobacteraceae bacterium]
MNSQRLYIRADAGSTMGTGHIMRCIALAQAWRQWGGTVCFITHDSNPVLVSKINDQGYDHKLISTPSPDPIDINQTLQFLDNHELKLKVKKISPPAWVILDGYHFGPEYQKAIRRSGYRLLVIDDYNHLPRYYADILLNQNPGARCYPYQCSNNTQKLFGTDYTLLRNDFLSKNKKNKAAPRKASRILVTMGGTDPNNITPLIIQAIQNLNDPDLKTRVVIGPSNCRYKLLTTTTDTDQIRLMKDPIMPDLMEWADIAITAGGSTCWELCFMGVPFIVIPVALNQVDIAAGLEREIGAFNAGPIESLTPNKITDMLAHFILSQHKREQMIALGQDLVDGDGTKRIFQKMFQSSVPIESGDTKNKTYRFNTDDKPEIHIGQVTLTEKSNAIAIDHTIKAPFQGLGLTPVLMENVLIRQSLEETTDYFNTHTFLLDPKPLSYHKRLTISLISDKDSWINPYLFQLFVQILLRGHRVNWVHKVNSITASDITFYLGCGQLAPGNILALNKHNIIVHGSALPHGKGWSPISWQILEGQNTIPLTLFEAAPRVDSGPIYLQKKMQFRGHELIDEIHQKTAKHTINICLDFLENHRDLILTAKKQRGKENFYPKRTPKDSRLDPDKTIREQFNLLRISDNQNYPVFFTLNQMTYKLTISKMETDPDED